LLGLDEQTLERRSLARNEALFRQGEKVTAIYFVEAGRLRLERQTFDGRSLVVGTTSSGKFYMLERTGHRWSPTRCPPVPHMRNEIGN
jgi:CRP-like cAMP-binding protein